MAEKPVDEQLAIFKTSFETFITTAESYPDTVRTQTGVTGEWSAREVIAHLNGWLVECLRRLPRFAVGTGNAEYNLDAFNAVSLWLRDDKDYEQLLEELHELVAQVVQFINELNDVYKERDDRYSAWLRSLAHEADNHGAELRQFLDAQAS